MNQCRISLAVCNVWARITPILVGGLLALASTGRAEETLKLPSVSGGQTYQAAKRLIDPRRDGWESEAQSEAVQSALKILAKKMASPLKLTAESVTEIAADDFACRRLRPEKLNVVYRDATLLVRRGDDYGAPIGDATGARRLAKAVRDLVAPFGESRVVRAELKHFRIATSGDTLLTKAYFHATTIVNEQAVQQNGVLNCQWAVAADGAVPKLRGLRMSDYEEVITRKKAGPMLVDCTVAVIGRNKCFKQQLRHGQEHWMRRIPLALGTDNFGHHGLAVGDVNGDGLEDVYVCQTGGLPNRLFVQNPDGTATDRSAEAGVDIMERSQSALLIDLDNDGDQDLVLGTLASILLLENDGSGKFTIKSMGTLPGAFSMTAADYDADGDLDIFACFYAEISTYQQNAGLGLQPIPYHDANNGAPNALLRNEGGWKFVDVTGDVGLDQNNNRWSFAASWEDFDNDGDVDLYVANDFGRNSLYRNDGGKFHDVAAEAGVEDIASGMSVSWADFNRDGHMDLYVGNMFSAAGNRITFQRRFHQRSDEQIKQHLQRLARGNSLFVNTGVGKFVDASQTAHVTMGRWSWGSEWVDLNNDGWQDLVVTNGYITGHQPDDL